MATIIKTPTTDTQRRDAEQSAIYAAKFQQLQQNINVEETARINSDTALQNSLNAEIQNRKDSDTALQTALNAEIQNRINSDTALQTALNAEIQNRKDSDTALQTALNAEIQNRKDSDTALQNSLNAEIQNRINSDTALQNSLNAEIQNRKDSDTALQNSLNAEIQNRKDSDTALQNSLNAEIQNRKDSDTALQNSLNAEIQNRINSDTALQTALNAEIQNRINSDTALQTALNAEIQNRINSDTALNTAIFNEATARMESDTALANSISTNLTTAKTYADTKATSTLNSAKSYADTKATSTLNSAKSYSDSNLQTAKNYTDSKISEGGDSTDWQSIIDAETSARIASDTALSNSISTNLQTAKNYTDSKATTTLNSAKSYSDTNLNTAKSYSDTNLQAAKDYTDSKISSGGGDSTDWQSIIDAETSARIASDTALENSISDLQTALTTETTNRTSGDNLLRTSVNNEVSARQSAVSSLRGELTTVITNNNTSTLNSANTYTNGKISTEETARIEKDAELEEKINTEIAALSTQLNTLLTTINERITTAVAAALQAATDYTDDKTDEIKDALPSDTQIEPSTTQIKLQVPTLEVAAPVATLNSSSGYITWNFTISGYDSTTMTLTYPANAGNKTNGGFYLRHVGNSNASGTSASIDNYFDSNHNGLPVSISVALKDTSKYCWSDSSTDAKTASATPAPYTFTFDTPVQDIAKTYSGSAIGWWKGFSTTKNYGIVAIRVLFSSYTADVDVRTDAGTYTIPMTPQNWCLWKDSGKDTRNFSFTIAQADWSFTVTDENGKSYTLGTADTNPLLQSDVYEIYPKNPDWNFTVTNTCGGTLNVETRFTDKTAISDTEFNLRAYSNFNVGSKKAATVTITPPNGNYKTMSNGFEILYQGSLYLENLTWGEIAEMSANGTLINKFNVGDIKRIYLKGTFNIVSDADTQIATAEFGNTYSTMSIFLGMEDGKALFAMANTTQTNVFNTWSTIPLTAITGEVSLAANICRSNFNNLVDNFSGSVTLELKNFLKEKTVPCYRSYKNGSITQFLHSLTYEQIFDTEKRLEFFAEAANGNKLPAIIESNGDTAMVILSEIPEIVLQSEVLTAQKNNWTTTRYHYRVVNDDLKAAFIPIFAI